MGNYNVKDYPPYLDYPKPRKLTTNADRIRSMNDEELAEWMALNSDCYYCKAKGAGRCDNFTTSPCNVIWLDWLKQEAGE